MARSPHLVARPHYRTTALRAASGQLQATLSAIAIACGHPAGHPCTCLDRIVAALDEMCAGLAAHGDLLANPLTGIPAPRSAP